MCLHVENNTKFHRTFWHRFSSSDTTPFSPKLMRITNASSFCNVIMTTRRWWNGSSFVCSILKTFQNNVSKAAAAAKLLQSCPTLCNPINGSPPGSPVPGILQARTLEWVAISFSNAWKWKVKVKSLRHVNSSWPHGLQPTRLLHPWDFPGKSAGVGCHCLLRRKAAHVSIMISYAS